MRRVSSPYLEPYNSAAAAAVTTTRFPPLEAKISEMFQNMRQIETAPPVYHRQICKKEMDRGREKKLDKQNKKKNRNNPLEDSFSPFKSTQPALG